jgi:hypothetical protein
VSRLVGWLAIALLVVDSVLIAMYELFLLPLHLPRSLGGGAFPVMVLAAAVTMPLLVWAAARVAPRPGATLAPLVAWLLTVLALGVVGPGGDRVLPPDWRALLLMVAATVPGGLVASRLMIKQHLPADARPADVRDG